MDERKRIGSRITELRNAQNMSMEELATKIETHPGNIKRMEEGKYNVTFDLLQKTAEAFNMNIDFIDKSIY